jgi:tetratricopeptide (TPR) repeat protein
MSNRGIIYVSILKSIFCLISSFFGYSNLKKYNEAIEWYDKAIKIDPSYALAWYKKELALEYVRKQQQTKVAVEIPTQNLKSTQKLVLLSSLFKGEKEFFVGRREYLNRLVIA